MSQRLSAFGGQMGLVPAGMGGATSQPAMGSFALYAFPTWPGSRLWGPSGSAFGDVGDLVVGSLGDLVVGDLGGPLNRISDWWESQTPNMKLLVFGTAMLGVYLTNMTGRVRGYDVRGARRFAFATNPRRSYRRRRNAGKKRGANRPWSGVYGTAFQARYKSKSYRKRHNRRR